MQERSIVLVLPTQGKGELNILVDPILLNTIWQGFNELDIGPDGYVAYLNQVNQKVIASTGLLPREENLLMMTSSRQQLSSVKPVEGTDLLIVVATSREWVLRNWRNLPLMIIPVSFLSNLLIAFLFIRLIYSAQLLKYDIRIGLQKFEFELHYQPIFDLQTGHCIGSEALVRWRHGSRGLLLPGLFIPVAEQTGSIVELGEWVVERALLDQKQFLKKYPNLHVSVNLSPTQLSSKLSSQNITWFLRQHQEAAEKLIFEITETTLIEDYQENIIKAIADLRALGAKVALDDFGTGHCGINYLSRLNFDYLKIDQRFTSASDLDSTLTRVLDGIIDLGQRLKVDFIAEGIETEAQKRALLRKGIRYGQGRFLAHPMDIKEFEQFLNTHQSPSRI
ncbi:MAG: EAL domain-containing protein [Cyanobacteria bacterium P01_H01_bin.58]